MKKVFLIYSFCLFVGCFFNTTFAQKKSLNIIKISGKLIDQRTGAPITFANVGVIGTYTGTASNEEGIFEVKIPGKFRENKVQISAIGYHTFTQTVAEIAAKSFHEIQLKPSTYQLGNVEVLGESRLQHTRIRKAVDNIVNNYLQTPFNYHFFYRSKKESNSKEKTYEAAAMLYDRKGYELSNPLEAFEERNYLFIQSRKNFAVETFSDSQHLMDDLLDMDIVRTTGNILNKQYLHNYEIGLENITELEGDTVWVISYESKKPTLATTGDYYATKYSGKIYIKKKDFAVVKNEMHIQSNNYSPHGRSYFVNPVQQLEKPVSINYEVTTVYKKHLHFYYLSYINYKRSHKWKKSSGEIRTENILAEMMVTNVKTFKPKEISSRMYYETIPFDENFWKTYNVILD